MPNWKAVILGLVLSLALPVVVFHAFNVRSPDVHPEPPNLFALFGAWLVALSLPGFCAGLVARRRGWLYGAILALVPIAFAALVGYEVPIAVVVVLWAVGLAAGSLGEFIGKRRHAL